MERLSLEMRASRALLDARLLEDALHSLGRWTVRWGSIEVEATRVRYEDRIEFIATFPDACWLAPPEEGAMLMLDGEVRGIRRIDHPGDTQFVLLWQVRLAEPQREGV